MASDPQVVDSYDDTIMFFLEDAEAILEARKDNKVKMTDNQYNLLSHFYEVVENYSLYCKLEDKDIIKDPKWIEITELAKKVYDELKDK